MMTKFYSDRLFRCLSLPLPQNNYIFLCHVSFQTCSMIGPRQKNVWHYHRRSSCQGRTHIPEHFLYFLLWCYFRKETSMHSWIIGLNLGPNIISHSNTRSTKSIHLLACHISHMILIRH